MAHVAFKGEEVNTSGTLPEAGAAAPDFILLRADLSEASLEQYAGKRKLLNIFHSLDTSVCATAFEQFNKNSDEISDCVILNISMDLPFAQSRFCQQKELQQAETLSAFRSEFPDTYGVRITDGPLRGLCTRAVVVLDAENVVRYTQLVPEITKEPDYQAALEVLKSNL